MSLKYKEKSYWEKCIFSRVENGDKSIDRNSEKRKETMRRDRGDKKL